MAMSNQSHGSLESDSSDDEDGDQIEFHLDGHTVLLSTKTKFYLTRVVAFFSTYFSNESWTRDIALHTKLHGAESAKNLARALHRHSIYCQNYLPHLRVLLKGTRHIFIRSTIPKGARLMLL